MSYSSATYGLSNIVTLAEGGSAGGYTGHKPTCSGEASCGDVYWTCKGIKSSGTALHLPRTCQIKGRKWNSSTSSYETVTCGMSYRNCDNPGGRCFNGKVSGNPKHNDDVTGSNTYYTISPPGGNTPTPTDGTPNCPDCTSHCSSPCSCTNSGTCNGTVTDSTPNCQDCTSDCSSPCSCSNSGTCGGTVTDNTPDCSYCTDGCSSCQTPEPVYCARAACAAEVSDRLEHRVDSCTNCGATYWTCYPGAINNHETTFTCRRPGCGATFTRCSNGTCTSDWGTSPYHWAQ